ncbi:hypothetical protein BJ138DRAFT_1138293 [Hygrophoropsis aurantiaca]|uniref:Uncharacterized protein n=1 Tax=Hygrophoropsis aurantiaca TaxID=72124 RepID=A0ACB7ZWI4_9AGAM|nr:hypothetical protein BJ138DRAFT_1138293 [Hygrophoropsis aurantiaca]
MARSHLRRTRDIPLRCPSCGRRFQNATRVAQHMNQPTSTCVPWQNDLIRLSQARRITRPRNTTPGPTTQVDSEQMEFSVDSDVPQATDVENMGVELVEESAGKIEWFEGAGMTYGAGDSFMSRFNSDPYADDMAKINSYLSLRRTQVNPLSFRTAQELRKRVEMLPSGPRWKFKPVITESPTKRPLRIFYRDPVECLQAILSHPPFAEHIDFVPRKVFECAARLARVYSSWMTGDSTWKLQVSLPKGASLLGVILSSDKTQITNMTGDRSAHPLLISLANLDVDIRNKTSQNAYLLLALLPIAKFIHKDKRIQGVLSDRLLHQSLDIVLEPLKIAASIGVMMSDPAGQLRYCFTPIAAYIADTPEQIAIATVLGLTSPVTMAVYTDFGDSERHDLRTGKSTLDKIASVVAEMSPSALEAFFESCKALHLNGVHLPFWRDWVLADPSQFLLPELLHHLHKFFWDHERLWCVNVVSAAELDYRFSILQTCTGYRTFNEGISSLKQVTGRDHRSVQRYMVGLIAGAAPRDFVIAMHAMMDFRYLAQAPRFTEDDVCKVERALKKFHCYKPAIINAGGRAGKNGVIDNWHIPKLELLQGVAPAIRSHGALMQWTADTTEHAHIELIKEPANSGNNQDYDPQICRYLDRQDKCTRFEIATSLREEEAAIGDNGDNDEIEDLESTLPRRKIIDYFAHSRSLLRGEHPRAPRPYRTFAAGPTSLHLGFNPTLTRMTVDRASTDFNLPDLRPALADFLARSQNNIVHSVGGRRQAGAGCSLPFERVQVWCKVRIQLRNFHCPDVVECAQTVNAFPPSKKWPSGQYDSVIVNSDPDATWPTSGLDGHFVAHLRLIFRPINSTEYSNFYFAYVERLNVSSIDAVTGMHVLQRALRTNGDRVGDVIPLSQIRSPAHLIPRFGQKANIQLTKETSNQYSTSFFLNKYWNKEIFYALHRAD